MQCKYQETERSLGGGGVERNNKDDLFQFTFSNHFIHVRVVVDPEPILGMRRECTLDWTPFHFRASFTHSLGRSYEEIFKL